MDNIELSPHYEENGATLYHGDCLEVISALPDNSVDSVITDPPYELGFMGKKWDGSGIAYSVELWRECFRVLKPGGHLLAFGGTRTWHRLAVAIEDSGFEVRDSIAWMYGQGFPKSLDVSKAIDKKQGAKRKVIKARKFGGRSADTATAGASNGGTSGGYNYKDDRSITAPATSEAEKWSGWGTALKPAFEPIVVARKPLIGTVAENVLEHGTGALNIDASRIGTDGGTRRDGKADQPNGAGWENMRGHGIAELNAGRFPANVILTHHADCERTGSRTESVAKNVDFTDTKQADGWGTGKAVTTEQEQTTPVYECAEGCPAAMLDKQSGVRVSNVRSLTGTNHKRADSYSPDRGEGDDDRGYSDKGGASRFFKQTEWEPELDAPFTYIPKPSKKERPSVEGVSHPTVKPLKLMRYLVKLVTPPGGIVLDPFAGSGTTLEAAVDEGFSAIGIELTEEYLPLIVDRLKKLE